MPKRSSSEVDQFAPIQVRNSRVHGKGVFAKRDIRKGERVVEYLGDRISHDEADRRYEDHDVNDNHTFLFTIDRHLVIDGGVGGNAARYINHHCDGNCESVIEKRRVFVEAVRNIKKGEELGYDYAIPHDKDDPPNVLEIYACRCGSSKCRGSMLEEPVKPRRKQKRVVTAKAKTKAKVTPSAKVRPAATNRKAKRGVSRRK